MEKISISLDTKLMGSIKDKVVTLCNELQLIEKNLTNGNYTIDEVSFDSSIEKSIKISDRMELVITVQYQDERYINISVHINTKINLETEAQVDNIVDFLSVLFPKSYITCTSYPLLSKIWSKLRGYNQEFTAKNLGNLGGLSVYQVYPPQYLREKYFVKLTDDFYRSIPVQEVKTLTNGSIYVKVFSLTDSFETQFSYFFKLVEYYREKKIELGIWQKVYLWPNWRETYKDILEEKGLI